MNSNYVNEPQALERDKYSFLYVLWSTILHETQGPNYS